MFRFSLLLLVACSSRPAPKAPPETPPAATTAKAYACFSHFHVDGAGERTRVACYDDMAGCEGQRGFKIEERDTKGMSKDDVTACTAATSVWCYRNDIGEFCYGSEDGCKAERLDKDPACAEKK